MRLYKPHPRASFPLRVAISVAIILAVLFSCFAQTPLSGRDWIFILDTSKSMHSKGAEAKSIFDSVKQALKNLVDGTGNGDTVTLYTFDSEVKHLYDRQPINGPVDKENLK